MRLWGRKRTLVQRMCSSEELERKRVCETDFWRRTVSPILRDSVREQLLVGFQETEVESDAWSCQCKRVANTASFLVCLRGIFSFFLASKQRN